MRKINTRKVPGLESNEAKRVAFSPDGNMLAVACSSQNVLVFDMKAQTDEPYAKLRGHGDCVFDVAWAPWDSGLLVSASHDHTWKCWTARRP